MPIPIKTAPEKFTCSICGRSARQPVEWYLLAENTLLDRIKILHWERGLARADGMHSVCSVAHVRELVVHWMATSSLSYPFVRMAGKDFRKGIVVSPPPVSPCEVSTGTGCLIAEFAVHRESLNRALVENPKALAPILEALMEALPQTERQTTEPGRKPSHTLAEPLHKVELCR